MPIRPTETVIDWFYALNWMRNNESVKIVASWWDYGYWITIIGNKTTLADNGTLNMTQIEYIGWMFLSDETNATNILKKFESPIQGPVTHVAIFITFDTSGGDLGWGEESKWRWMARISEKWTNRTDTVYGNSTLGKDWFDTNGDGSAQANELISNGIGNRTIIYKMMQNVKYEVSSQFGALPDDAFKKHFQLVYTSFGGSVKDGSYACNKDYLGAYGVIGIFEVKY